MTDPHGAQPESAPDLDARGVPLVLVTGGSAGIGRAIAEEYARKGRALLLVARREGPLAEAAAELKSRYRVAVATLALDITAADALAQLSAAAARAGGYVDVLVNNCGIGLSGPFLTHDAADLQRLCTLNMLAPTALMRGFLPAMVARGRGGVLNVGSLAGLMPGPNQAAYYASKAYLISLTEAVRYETRGTGVRVAIVVPGAVATSFHAAMGAEHSLYLKVLPVMAPAQVARSAVFWFQFGRTLIVPGVLHHVSVVALRLLPHSVILPVMSWLLYRPQPAGAGPTAGGTDGQENSDGGRP